jgi:exodeoxyribonuclease V alpha subunit
MMLAASAIVRVGSIERTCALITSIAFTYLKHLEEHPEDEAKLDEIRVLIDEPALLPGFKYVSEQVHDDQALALLYKMRRSIEHAEAHGIADVSGALERIDGFIADCWADRGLYPGLSSVVGVLADLSKGEIQIEGEDGHGLVLALRGSLDEGQDLADALFDLLATKDVPEVLLSHKRVLRLARLGFLDHGHRVALLRKLALFTLTPRQVGRILAPNMNKVGTFGPLAISDGDIVANPYLLAESYVPSIVDPREERADLDREQRSDGPIDYAAIDLGMFPDEDHLEPHDVLHDLTVAGPERLRAFAIEGLREAESLGHSFLSSTALAEHAAQHPLLYRNTLSVSEAQLLSPRHLAHFRERLHVEVVDGKHFFYRLSTWQAEQIVMRFVTNRLGLPVLKADTSWLANYLAGEAAELSITIPDFDRESFLNERTRLMTGTLTQPFYCVTGRPGSGKSQAVIRLLGQFDALSQKTLVLAPTGKAALRLNQARPEGASWEAQTIDRWVWRSGLADYRDAEADLAGMGRAGRFEPFDNVIVEETSMVDLFQLALIFRAIEVHQPTSTKRVILVGDENQLPPIGCGKPLQDILSYLRTDAKLEAANHVRLVANCRQQHDTKVLDAAHLFAGRNRYHSELFDAMCAGGQISPFLDVRYYDSHESLHAAVDNFVTGVLEEAVPGYKDMPKEQAFNLLMRLFENGSVPGFRAEDLDLDRAQLLSPYRGGPSGALGLSSYIRDIWRADVAEQTWSRVDGFFHSDKLVRISNYYQWNSTSRTKELRLSNGSIGVLAKTKKKGWQGFFPESQWSLDWKRMDEEDFELAYALTVHKAQGSEFEEVLMVVPERRALLSSELLYTAMTRSKGRLTLLIERSERANPLSIARERSVLAMRNSSVFAAPFDAARLFEPEAGIRVKSKIEYMIYTSLVRARDAGELTFAYEEPIELPFDDRNVRVRPDFTVQVGHKKLFWEHLGMLDRQDYARDWRERRRAYQVAGLEDVLLTTDDAAGVSADALAAVIADLLSGNLGGRADLGFSKHHYAL